MFRKPVSRVCPECGSAEYRSARPRKAFTFINDRVCAGCNVCYTPPTPLPFALLTLVMAIPLLLWGGTCAVTAYSLFVDREFAWGLVVGSLSVVIVSLSVASARTAAGSFFEVRIGPGFAFPVLPLPGGRVPPLRDDAVTPDRRGPDRPTAAR